MLTDADQGRLRDALLSAGYTVDGVSEALGDVAHRALGRGETTPGLRATAGGGRLATLIRLFLLGAPEPGEAVRAAFGSVPVGRAVDAGLLAPTGGDRLRAALDLRPYGDPGRPWYVVSDLGGGPGRPVRADHVLGVGGASLTLAHATVRRSAATALDVGTGCGVQALHASVHARHVVVTDRNPRALTLARMTARLSGVPPWEYSEGDLFDPVARRRFDLVVSNPPFVIGPRARFTYRDSGLPGDEVSRRLITGVEDQLTDGGVAVLLANWLHVAGHDWRDRVRGWLTSAGCDGWALQREVQDPAEYAELWLRDSGDSGTPHYAELYDDWLAWFAAHHIVAIGFGIVVLRRTSRAPVVRVDEVRHGIEPPLGPVFDAWLHRVELLRGGSDALLAARLRLAEDVTRVERSQRGVQGWEVVARALEQGTGLRLRGGVDEVGAALAAACDGRLPVAALLELLAVGFDVDRAGALRTVRDLVDDGFLVPAD